MNSPARPVTSLCTYAWWPVSHTIASFGLSNTRCNAKVSSTTPRLGERGPPVREVCSTRNVRTSVASSLSRAASRAFRSAGEWIVSRIPTLWLTLSPRHEFRQLDAQAWSRAARPAEDGRQLVVGVPGGRGDDDVRPRLAANEVGAEHPAHDGPRPALLAVPQLRALSAQQHSRAGAPR